MQKKQAYEKMSKDLESSKSKLEKEVKGYREEMTAYETRYHHLNGMLAGVQAQRDRAKREGELYRTKKKSFRDVCVERIETSERLGKHLREKQATVEARHDHDLKQCDIWRDLAALMQCKVDAAIENTGTGQSSLVRVSEDRLVL